MKMLNTLGLLIVVTLLYSVERAATLKHASQAEGEILDVKSCEDVLSLNKVDFYQPLTLNFPTFKVWPHLEKIQKAVFLIDRAHLVNVRREFVSLRDNSQTGEALSPTSDELLHESPSFVAVPLDSDSSTPGGMEDNGHGISLNTLLTRWSEFTAPKTLYSMFQECDTDLDMSLNWIEYLMCRNQYNQYGAPFDVSEFDYIENIVLHDFQERLLDPTDPMTLALLARDEL